MDTRRRVFRLLPPRFRSRRRLCFVTPPLLQVLIENRTSATSPPQETRPQTDTSKLDVWVEFEFPVVNVRCLLTEQRCFYQTQPNHADADEAFGSCSALTLGSTRTDRSALFPTSLRHVGSFSVIVTELMSLNHLRSKC